MPENFLHGVEVLEVTDGPRPIRSVSSSVIGLVGTGDDNSVAALVEIGATNSKLKFTAANGGVAGNAITITTTKGVGNNASLAVSVTGNAISISLATDGSAVATSTASQVLAAVNASGPASALVAASLATGSNGTGLYAVHASTALAGGVDADFPLDTPVLVTTSRNIDTRVGADTYLAKAVKAIFKQTGAIVVVVRTADVSASDPSELTGIYALKSAQATLGYTPRMVVAEDSDTLDVLTISKEVAESLKAIAIVGLGVVGDTAFDTATEATAYAAANGNQRTFFVWPCVNGGEDVAPYVAGLQARVDNALGFWWSPSNQEIFGITSIDYPVDFELGETSSTANILNEGNVTTIIRQNGFRLWGNRVPAADPRYQFLSVRRTADIIQDSLKRAHMWAVDRAISKTYLEDVSEGVNDYLRRLINIGAILGGACWPDPDLNTPSSIANGQVYFNFDFTPPFPAERVTFRSILTNDYVTEIF